MIVSCPNCSTKFNLPDDKVVAGAKLRCTVCKEVFALPDANEAVHEEQTNEQPIEKQEELSLGSDIKSESPSDSGFDLDGKDNLSIGFGSESKKPKKSGTNKFLLFLIIVLLIVVAGASTWLFAPQLVEPYLDKIPFLSQPEAEEDSPAKDLISQISLRGVRQYSIANEKLGQISVIEGKALNNFQEPRELIKIEASLYDKDGKVLVSKQQLAGTSVSLFQLQVLGEAELEQALNNKIDILSNNTNIQPGVEVPFMIVFYSPSPEAAEFGVKVIEAKIPPVK